MTPERWQQINALLDAVLELPPGHRAAYLDAHCADDPDLRREVTSLIEAHDEAQSFLEEPAKDYAATLIDMADEHAADALVGKEIDGYRILGILGRGGMGLVYKAEDEALSRTVALKMIDPALARDEAFVRRFRAEARALARIDSPHIVGIHAMRQHQDSLYIVMEYVDGGTLTDLERRGPVAWPRARPIIREMLTALEHAHSVGVVHRDIKPSNIMLTQAGRVKVTDFGLAKVRQKSGATTVTQGISGTLYYMSPEQVQGLRDLDHRSDLYSMGVTIYEMLTGGLPLDRDAGEFAIMRAIVEDRPPAPPFKADVPAEVAGIVLKALEKDPARRFQRAAEMRAAFEALPHDDAATIVEGVEPYRRPVLPGRRRVLMLGAAGGVLVLLALALVFLWPGSAATLTVSSTPSGATVFLNGDSVGTTPLSKHALKGLEGTLASVRVEKDGYEPFDTSGQVVEGRAVVFDAIRLPALPEVPASFTISSTPAAAEVLYEGSVLGTTPIQALQVQVRGETARLTFRKAEYVDKDTLVRVADGQPVTVQVRLTPLPTMRITSTPSGAAVFVKGERVGTTPLQRLPVPVGSVEVVLRKTGCDEWSNSYQTVAGQAYPVSVTLRNCPTEERKGTLVLSVAPAGSIRVTGEPQCRAGTACDVTAGQKAVEFSHPTYAAVNRTVRVDAGQTIRRTFQFEQEVNVGARDAQGSVSASVWVDDRDTGKFTPATLTLGPGDHKIEVLKGGTVEGRENVSVVPGFDLETRRIVISIDQ